MVRLRVYLTLALALLLLGSGAWTPASHTAASDSLDPTGLTAIDWQAIQSQVAKLTAADGVMRAEVRNSVAVSGDTAVEPGTASVEFINKGYKASGHYFYKYFADVRILNQDKNPVNRAIVYSDWWLTTDKTLVIHGRTDKNGLAVLGLSAGLVEGTWNICVTEVVKSGWSYVLDPTKLCDTVVVP